MSYVDAMHRVLTAKAWFTMPKFMLSGMTASCFRLSLHRQLHEDSPTAYNWMAEHTVAADLAGIVAGQAAGFHFSPTFPLYQRRAVEEIRQSLDQGTGAVCWKDQFVIITGYDDARQVFYYQEGQASAAQELPYCQFGKNKTPYWYCQIYEGQIGKELPQIIRESFIQAVYKAETHDPMLPEEQYACGLQAYDAMLEAFSSDRYDTGGAYETMKYYAICKKDAALYTREACTIWPELEETASHYDKLSAVYEQLALLLKREPDHSPAPCTDILLELVREAKAAEASAIESIRRLLREPIANRFLDIGLR
ncbi:hypothetical protein [Paenibacillus sp. MMS20-IR301]|uniref:hypothetical protein n=1 Tax=Paenibacillus sp. MMS20-IR301 TaxID=2895946 RepID=UPI0028ECA4EB|nr:hypothetical protein [Paenibacillus sp. MMS20-IR301]WNS45730.1 hypothetical protein LOS79_10805 [Paenibacillus sp. MMS20-IR301]